MKSMIKLVLASVMLLFAAGAAKAQDITGDWLGTLHAGAADLQLVLHITNRDAGGLKATLDSGPTSRKRSEKQGAPVP